ncbi:MULTISPECIES: SRPBCC family protein [unclassified Corynebacterium]|uniref:SRPBCC family protein n=1 Tax=unclassified Corynebacterium TaxID=2624378 RepID=UPI00309AEACD
MSTALITATRTVNAAPRDVWAVVSDLTAMGDRSPQCRKMVVLGGTPGVGTTTLNLNRRGVLFWPTWSTVTQWAPEDVLEWRVPINGSRWRFSLTDNGDGTTDLTESRLVDGDTSVISRAMVAAFLGGNDTFESELAEGMEQTLAAIASSAERAG